jgi:hypothetical protein
VGASNIACVSRVARTHVFRSAFQQENLRAAVACGDGRAQSGIAAPDYEHVVHRFSPELGSDPDLMVLHEDGF